MFQQTEIDDINKNGIVCKLRWLFIVAQLLVVMITMLCYNGNIPEYWGFAILGIGVFINIVHMYLVKSHRVKPYTVTGFLLLDLLQWTALLAFFGGMNNPLQAFAFIPVVVSIIYVSEKAFVLLLFIMIALTATIMSLPADYLPQWHFNDTIAWYIDHYAITFQRIEMWKDWTAITCMGMFVGVILYTARHEAIKYRLSQQASSRAYQEYMRVAAIGTMAAAAVHELGTPLNTIHLIATEMSEDDEMDNRFADDVSILVTQTERCQNILKNLVKMDYNEGNQEMDALGVSMLMEQIAFPYRKDNVQFKVNVNNEELSKSARIRWVNEWTYSIGNILQNAFQFARSRVTVSIDLRKSRLMLSVIDDGKGFPQEILETVGDPYISGRSNENKGNHMGLGLFIAKSLIEQTGGSIEFSNSLSGGACVTIVCKF